MATADTEVNGVPVKAGDLAATYLPLSFRA